MVLQNYQKKLEMTSNMLYNLGLGVGYKCPRKIHLNTQCRKNTSYKRAATAAQWSILRKYHPKIQNPSKDQNTKSELSLSNKAKCKQCLVLYSKLLGFRLFLAVLRPCFGPCFGPSVSQYNLWTTGVCIFNSKFLKKKKKNDI